MKPAKVEVHIGELVLRGLAPADRDRVGLAVERELARLIAEQSVPARWTRSVDIPRLDAGVFEVAPGARPAALGGQVARAVYRGMGG
jgi:hypothetical protein